MTVIPQSARGAHPCLHHPPNKNAPALRLMNSSPPKARLELHLLPKALLSPSLPSATCTKGFKTVRALRPTAGALPPGSNQTHRKIYARDVCISVQTANAGNNLGLRRFLKPIC